MNDQPRKPKIQASDHKLTIMGARVATIKWEGRELPMTPHQGGWRIRSRSKSFPVDLFLPVALLAEAKKLARIKLADLPEKKKETFPGTLEEVVRLYLSAPKRCAAETAVSNVARLRVVARDAWGKTLEQVPIDQLSALWPAYVAAKQGRKQPDYSTRRRGNYGIISAIKQSASVFLPALRPFYGRHGVKMPPDAVTILWPATPELSQPEARDGALIEAWKTLRVSDAKLWAVVGLARFAGLRQGEILAYKGKWLEHKGAASYVRVKDREEDGFFTKTGANYTALILSPELIGFLTAMQPEQSLLPAGSEDWIERKPQAWLRQFTGTAKPLHRLRGLYADHVLRETEEAILARQAAIKEASANLGHTSTKTTTGHYLDGSGK